MDQRENELDLSRRGDWEDRLSRIRFEVFDIASRQIGVPFFFGTHYLTLQMLAVTKQHSAPIDPALEQSRVLEQLDFAESLPFAYAP